MTTQMEQAAQDESPSYPDETPRPTRVVRAAGAVCWRTGPKGLQVLLIHRPAYDDWSFPKGKLEADELNPVAAVREFAEETGLRVRLGQPLPEVTYRDPKNRVKVVSYWAAEALERVGRPNPREVDQVEWLDLASARARLSQSGDVVVLDRLAELAATDTLETSTVLVVRHGTARPRDAWARADADRPLIAAGRRQSTALVELLSAWRPDYALSSPWTRCVDTLAPYARKARLKVRTKGGLSERGHRRNPDKAARHVRDLLERPGVSLVCTHRPVLPTVMATLARHLADSDLASAVPSSDPYLAPAELLVVHVAQTRQRAPRIVAVERHTVFS